MITPIWPNLIEELESIPEASISELDMELGPSNNPHRAEIETFLTKQFNAFAEANTWGPWVQIAIYLGEKSFKIMYKPLGNTQVYGAVRYLGPNGQILQKFKDSISIRTGDKWGVIYVCFFGISNQSVIQGLIDYEI